MAPDTTRMTDEECDRIARRMVEVFANTPLDGSAPGPSDVKGENHIADAGKLVPLTDPTDVVGEWAMLRKFLVDVGDSLSAYDCNAGLAENLVRILAAVAKLKATAAEPAQKLVKLPEGSALLVPLFDCMGDKIMWRGKWYHEVDPTLYGADAKRVRELEAERDAAVAELSAERDLCDKWEKANREAERLRNAIETHQYNNTGMACEHKQSDRELWSALTPPTAASGEKVTLLPTEHYYRKAMEVSAEIKGHSKPPSAPAAESDGGETTEVERLEQCIEVYERSCTQWAEQCHGLITEREALSARIAACEERCKAVVGWAQGVIVSLRESGNEATAAILTKSLDSVLAPKAGGEQS